MFLTISTIAIFASWAVGFIMLMLNAAGFASISGWIIAFMFWGPYAIFMLTFCGMLIYHMTTDPEGWKRGRRRKE